MDEKDYILIERYLQDDVSPEERIAVEQRIAGEEAFAAALTDRRQLNDHLRAVAHEEVMRPTLERLGERYFTEAPPDREAVVRPLGGKRRWLYGVAAAAVIALAVLAFGPWLSTPGTGYEQFAQHEPLSLTERGDPVPDAAAAEAAYNDGRYAEAVTLLRQYLAQKADDTRARLALGVSLLETDKDAEAIEIFEEIAEGKTALAAYGNWYLALAAVKRGDERVAREYLDLIPPSDTYLTKKAKELRATL